MRDIHSGFVGHLNWYASILVLLVAFQNAGCRSVSVQETADPHEITVEGVIVIMGNTPFEAPVLRTADNNLYVLRMDQARRNAMMTPLRARVRGRLSLDMWNGKPFAHLEVLSLEGVPAG